MGANRGTITQSCSFLRRAGTGGED
ncbi:hypothetical protein CCACVL1_04145 [Corchorus capsularis]|uniref:Uncharacterized protein n=1 Tax=Corchorus capsularis TaxID=210143 RepID=A0A1R3GVA7_COCAP|nr:hypothetical protein CCACVL1_23133 [Corchorus capsularis]OMO98624.1 hypothetical protein CCACVL1_04145 [Corchorus capsularis]